MDVIEIDAASHGLVEDARDLVMRALTAPAELRRRVYIIDEVHMLSPHAFNALLKLVEEPPPHVVFILATTDTHKVPATVISRTQRFDFRRISVAADRLEADAHRRGRGRDGRCRCPGPGRPARRRRDARRRVAARPGARLRRQTGSAPMPSARRSGLADESEISALLDAYLAGDAPAALDRIEALADVGRDMGQVAAQAEAEARRRLLRSASDPLLSRRLAGMLRTLAEAATVGAREGRARLALELLAVEAPPVPSPRATASAPVRAARSPGPGPGRRLRTASAPARGRPATCPSEGRGADPGADRRRGPSGRRRRPSVDAGAMSSSAPRPRSSRSCASAARSPSTALA